KLQRTVGLRDPDSRTEITDRLRRVAAPPDAGELGHPRIVPTVNTFFLHQSKQLALAEQRVGKAEAIELHLLGWKNSELLNEPVIQRAMIFKFERADGVGHVFDGIG